MATSEEFHAWLEGELNRLEEAARAKFGDEVNMVTSMAIGMSGGQGVTTTSLCGDEDRFFAMGQSIVQNLAQSIVECAAGVESGKVEDQRTKGTIN